MVVDTETCIRATDEEKQGVEAVESFLPRFKENLGVRA